MAQSWPWVSQIAVKKKKKKKKNGNGIRKPGIYTHTDERCKLYQFTKMKLKIEK